MTGRATSTMGAERPGRIRRALRWVGLVIVIATAATGLVAYIAIERLGPLEFDRLKARSVTVLDRDDRLLRAYTTPDGRWRLPVEGERVDARYQRMLLAYEDKRFFRHFGIDLLAIARAGLQVLQNQRIVSGASTLTMQVARLLEGKHERTFGGKFRQIVRAVQLERHFTKREILDTYFTLAPFGGNIEGVRAASLAYFGKEPYRLSLAEAALLVALPQSPELRRPDRYAKRALIARGRVLDRMVRDGVVTQVEARRAQQAPMPNARRLFPMLAAHLADARVSARPEVSTHRLTIDRDLQSSLETLARQHVRTVGSRVSAAAIVVDHTTGEVLAQLGSPGYLDEARFGSVDMARAIRSPGSALKPLIYGLAFESGLAHPETLIEDRPVRFDDYAPKNFDNTWRGTVSIRQALQLSLNIPAVKVLHAVGPTRLVARLREIGLEPKLPDATAPSLAVALGGLGLTLTDLAKLYAGLARGGRPIDLVLDREQVKAAGSHKIPRKLLSPAAAWYVGDVLLGTPPPQNARGGRIAFKTGTSYGYRDAWAVGFDGRHTVAVWIGRPDGTPTPALTGQSVAAPFLFDAFHRVAQRREPLGRAPESVLQSTAANLPPPLKRFQTERGTVATGTFVDQPLRIAFPPNKSDLEVVGADQEGARPLLIKATGGKLPLTWLVNGAPLETAPHRREAYWTPNEEGFVRLSVIDAGGQSDHVSLRLTR